MLDKDGFENIKIRYQTPRRIRYNKSLGITKAV